MSIRIPAIPNFRNSLNTSFIVSTPTVLVVLVFLAGCGTSADHPQLEPGLHGEIYLPEGKGPFPGLVIIHGSGGVKSVYLEEARYLAENGIAPTVQVSVPGEAIAAIRTRSLVRGDDVVVGLANRVVLPGRDHRFAPARQYHQVHRDLTVTVAAGARPAFAVGLPMAHVEGRAVESLPKKLELRAGTAAPTFVLPELVDVAAVLLTSDYPPLLGLALDERDLRF